MEAIEFVKKLGNVPSEYNINKLRKMNLSEEYLLEYVNNFKFFPNEDQNKINDPIMDLVLNFNGIGVVIGMITFDIDPFEDQSYFYFGRFEVDYLAINKTNQTIELLEDGTNNHVLCKCAVNSSQFLDAIFEGACFLNDLSFYDNIGSDQNLICQVAHKCSELAGGKEYLGFYQLLLGCFV